MITAHWCQLHPVVTELLNTHWQQWQTIHCWLIWFDKVTVWPDGGLSRCQWVVYVCRWQCPLCYSAAAVGVVGVAALIALTLYKTYKHWHSHRQTDRCDGAVDVDWWVRVDPLTRKLWCDDWAVNMCIYCRRPRILIPVGVYFACSAMSQTDWVRLCVCAIVG